MVNFYDLIPGAVQGFTRSIISYPFEVIKTDMQINNNNFFKTTYSFIKNDPRKFYRGIGVPLTLITVERSLQFYIYENTKKNNSIFKNSFLTSAITNTIFTPFAILQVNIMTSKQNSYTGLINFIKQSNIKKIFSKGIYLEISKNYLSTFTYFYIYSTLQNKLNLDNFYTKTFISGVFSSLGVWGIVLPIDTIKVRYQVSNKNFLHMLKEVNKGTILSLWSGYTPIAIRTMPSAGIGMIAYEYAKNKLKD